MGNREPSGVFGKEQVFGRKWVDMSLTLNPDIRPQPTLQAESCYQTKTPAQHENLLVHKSSLSEAAPGASAKHKH